MVEQKNGRLKGLCIVKILWFRHTYGEKQSEPIAIYLTVILTFSLLADCRISALVVTLCGKI